MKFLRNIGTTALLTPLGLSIAIAVLIIYLVAQVTDFSEHVTDFYAPTIHTVKSFAEATEHVKISMQEKGIPEEIAVFHLKDATSKLKKLSLKWQPDYRKHIEGMIIRAEELESKLRVSHVPTKDLSLSVNDLNREALIHVSMHDTELKEAKSGIKNSALKIRFVALFMLLSGVILTFRELQVHRLKEREKEKLSAIKAFVLALEARDTYTKGHSIRVADYAASIGKEMGIGKNDLERLNIAALMHDIGKIAISDGILKKEGKLGDKEWQEMRKHPVITARTLEPFQSLRDILPWTLYHHERYDGKGYPEGKRGMDVPLYAQIIALADAFDAMTSTRSYRKEMDVEVALSEIEKNKGKQWRPDVVKAFMRCIDKGVIKV